MAGDQKPHFDDFLNNNGAAIGFIVAVVFVIMLAVNIVKSIFF